MPSLIRTCNWIHCNGLKLSGCSFAIYSLGNFVSLFLDIPIEDLSLHQRSLQYNRHTVYATEITIETTEHHTRGDHRDWTNSPGMASSLHKAPGGLMSLVNWASLQISDYFTLQTLDRYFQRLACLNYPIAVGVVSGKPDGINVNLCICLSQPGSCRVQPGPN